MKTQGDIQWQNLYSGTEPTGFNSIALNDIIQITDGGYPAAGSSYVGSLTYGGPGFFILKTDAQGNVGTCTSCSVNHFFEDSLDADIWETLSDGTIRC